MVGDDGVDAWGYPMRTADKIALRALLAARRFEELTAHIEWFQTQAQADFRKEFWPTDALDAFLTADPSVGPLIEEWIKKTPTSFAPWAAHGQWKTKAGFDARGTKWAADTAKSEFQKMAGEHDEARTDLEQAMALQPKLLALVPGLIAMHSAAGEDVKARKAFDAAVVVCPNCYQSWSQYGWSLTPRWGGSYEALAAFAKTAPVARNPRFKLLAGIEGIDRCMTLNKKPFEGALDACNRAVANAPYSAALNARGKVFRNLGRLTEAHEDFARALKLRPMFNPRVVAADGMVLMELKRWDEAEKRVTDAWLLEPTEKFAQDGLGWLAGTLRKVAGEHAGAGEHQAALSLLDRAVRIDPVGADAVHDRGIERLAMKDAQGALADFFEAVRRDARFYRSFQQIDQLLTKEGKWDELVKSWTRFIEANPENSQGAYLARSTAYMQLHDDARALADAEKACSAKIKEGCRRVEQFGAHSPAAK